MRLAMMLCLATVCAALASRPVRGGLYHPAEPLPNVLSTPKFEDTLRNLRGLGSPPDPKTNKPETPLQKQYRERLAALREKQKTGTLTVEERVNLSAYLLRLMGTGEEDWAQKAVEVLEAIPEKERDFQVHGNLAAAYLATGRDTAVRYERARDEVRKALRVWPTEQRGYTGWELLWYRRVESFFLQLLTARLTEELRERNRPMPRSGQEVFETLQPDALFPLKLPESQQYGPGPFEAERLAGTPTDAVLLVRQLLYWLPADFRLQWLLAELTNAQEGDFIKAWSLLDDLTYYQNWRPRELHRHWQALSPYRDRAVQVANRPQAMKDELLAPVAPLRFLTGPLAWSAVRQEFTPEWTEPASRPVEQTSKDKDAPPESSAFKGLRDWQPIAVGFLAGAVVTFLLSLQAKQLRRRPR